MLDIGEIINGILVGVGVGIIIMAIRGVLSLQKLDETVKNNTAAQTETRKKLDETVSHNAREHAQTRTVIGNLDTRLVKVETEVHEIKVQQRKQTTR